MKPQALKGGCRETPFRDVAVTRVGRGEPTRARDRAAAEEPLEVRLYGEPFAVIMRTPGADPELATGFLFAEGVIRSASEIETVHHQPDRGRPDVRNVIDMKLGGGAASDLLARRRRIATSSSCGLCGRTTIESLRAEAPRIDVPLGLDRALVRTLPDRLRDRQVIFDDTGGLHAAGLFDADGALQDSAEDVGRHNAVDKVIGRALLAGRLPLASSVLFVSGRTSFEIVQKGFLAGIPVIGAVSAPSSLAIELAEEAGITLLGFVRGDSFNVYTHEARIR